MVIPFSDDEFLAAIRNLLPKKVDLCPESLLPDNL
jgi:hypothetical protein